MSSALAVLVSVDVSLVVMSKSGVMLFVTSYYDVHKTSVKRPSELIVDCLTPRHSQDEEFGGSNGSNVDVVQGYIIRASTLS